MIKLQEAYLHATCLHVESPHAVDWCSPHLRSDSPTGSAQNK